MLYHSFIIYNSCFAIEFFFKVPCLLNYDKQVNVLMNLQVDIEVSKRYTYVLQVVHKHL